MASSFFALFDDIAVLMDDVASMGKIATEKTAGILGDDLAVNAEKASGFLASRELPVLWKITKGSFLNKLMILPAAFLLSYFLPFTIVPILLFGGLYLAYEGAETIYKYIFHSKNASENISRIEMTDDEAQQFEDEKVKSAILVDFILSIEIIVLTLSTVVGQPLLVQVIVVTLISFLATVGVYGIVALIVRMDDMGYKLMSLNELKKGFVYKFGKGLVKALPMVIRALSVIGTIAMLLVAGGIYKHNIHLVHDLVHAIPSILGDFLVGLVVGIFALALVLIYKKIKGAIV